jgi:hypothetical protein
VGTAVASMGARLRPFPSVLHPLHHPGQRHPGRLGAGQGVLDAAQVLAPLPGQEDVRGPALEPHFLGQPPGQLLQPLDPPLQVRQRQLDGPLPSWCAGTGAG